MTVASAVPSAPSRRPAPHPLLSGLAWTLGTLAASVVIGWLTVQMVPAGVRAGGVPASEDTLSDVWWLALLLFLPVCFAARRSAWMALPAVAAAAVPQFLVARLGLDRMVADDGLEVLLFVVPILMTLLFLVGAVLMGTVRAVEHHRGG